jgi:hypothetical protein
VLQRLPLLLHRPKKQQWRSVLFVDEPIVLYKLTGMDM